MQRNIAGKSIKWYSHSEKIVWQFLKKLNIHSPFHPAITLLGIYPRERKTVHTETCTCFFITALFVTAKNY